MRRLAQAALGIVALLAVLLTPAQAQAYADFVQHGPVGNPQGFAVQCTSDGSTKWLYQGQYSQDKCPFNGRVNAIYTPPGYITCMRDYYQPNSGCVIFYQAGWSTALGGAWYAWTKPL